MSVRMTNFAPVYPFDPANGTAAGNGLQRARDIPAVETQPVPTGFTGREPRCDDNPERGDS